ncbi:cobalamin-independent synthase [Polychytrium aggregatum]|uniref:cobalamin-independent synthase n=1 Tax=Polychytrium aggregatum TaxID=110093 RepID=UPI0022FF1BC7|nr:cobalamin-independent synthase [Polychytrium aggregatum]KAI9206007.1 cobalamin-independent synthase [Polychytrium aggregatum]
MATATNLGFPRMGANRDLKKAVEAYWGGKITADSLLETAKELRRSHWSLQAAAGIAQGHIPSNDFSFYDQVLDHSVLFSAIPERYAGVPVKSELDLYFAMGRGLQKKEEGIDVPAMEMKKWFDTNYHYIVPEFKADQTFALGANPKPVAQFLEAKALGIETRPVILGPISYLHLGKPARGVAAFDHLSLLPALLPAYEALFAELAKAGAQWVQLDEPVLCLDLPAHYKSEFAAAYGRLAAAAPALKILLASYFGTIGDNLNSVISLPIAGLHLDLVRAEGDLDTVLARKSEFSFNLSLGVINGRNIWKADLEKAIAKVDRAVAALGVDRVLVAPSCSLLHSPHGLAAETKMDKQILDWLAFAVEKLDEISVVSRAVKNGAHSVKEQLESNKKSLEARRVSSLIHDPVVQARHKAITPEMIKRQSPFPARYAAQQARLSLPAFPTTTVGSFPQTKEVRVARQNLKKGAYTQEQYDEFIKQEIQKCIKFQEDVGLDVLVHGEFERNDMVEYFGENLKGYAFSANGWVQSYGSRCVKPPIIYGDVSRPVAMTVEWTKYAQTLTTKPMKGMLTGPVTMLCWSFVRDDQPRRITTEQLALAIRDEVQDLEAAGIPVIQIDEPAIREGLPLRRSDWTAYLRWAADAFLLSSTGVRDDTQIHTHMCYSDFQDIFTAIKDLDADVITIESSRSDLKLLSAFNGDSYPNAIGPGLYDIHSPRVPSTEEMHHRVKEMLKYMDSKLLWINPDCGLKTRGWTETDAALRNLVEVAIRMRN